MHQIKKIICKGQMLREIDLTQLDLAQATQITPNPRLAQRLFINIKTINAELRITLCQHKNPFTGVTTQIQHPFYLVKWDTLRTYIAILSLHDILLKQCIQVYFLFPDHP